MMNRLIYCFLAWISIESASGQAPLSVQQAVDIALKNNFDLQIVRNTAEAARVTNTAGVAGALPSINGEARDQLTNANIAQDLSNDTEIRRDNALSNNLSGNITVGYTLFEGFRINATRKRLNELEQQGRLEVMLQLQNTIAMVMTRYYDIVRQQNYRNALQRSREFAQQNLALIEQRMKVGLSNNADLYQARIDLNTSAINLSEQDLLIRRAEVELATSMSVAADTLFQLTDSMIIDRTLVLDTVLSTLMVNPELAIAASRVRESEQVVREVKSQRLPGLRVDGSYGFSRTQNEAGFLSLNQSYGPSVGATLSVPIYNGGAIRSREKEAALYAMNARIQEEKTKQELTAQAVKSFEAYRIALDQLESQEESARLAINVMEIQSKRFSLSQATLLDLRAAQASYENTMASLVVAQFIAKVAEIELKRLMSRL